MLCGYRTIALCFLEESNVWGSNVHPYRELFRDGHADADAMPIRNMHCIYCAISDICRMMRISALMRIGKYIRMANPSKKTLVNYKHFFRSMLTLGLLHCYVMRTLTLTTSTASVAV